MILSEIIWYFSYIRFFFVIKPITNKQKRITCLANPGNGIE